MWREKPLDEYENVWLRRTLTIILYCGYMPIILCAGILAGIVMASRLWFNDFFIMCWKGKKQLTSTCSGFADKAPQTTDA